MSVRLELSESYVTDLVDGLRREPLQADIIRLIYGAGEQYIALSSASVDLDVYYTYFTCVIDSKAYTVYYKD